MAPARTLVCLIIAAAVNAAVLGAPMYGLHDDAKYVVIFDSLGDKQCEQGQQETRLTDHEGNPVRCCHAPPPEPNSGGAHGSQGLGAESRKTDEELAAMLEPLENKCIVKADGWWSYQVCFKRDVRQVHLTNGQVTDEYRLGYYEPVARPGSQEPSIPGSVGQQILAEQYVNGSECDVRATQRSAEVHYLCDDHHDTRIVSVREVESCRYAIVVSTPLLCDAEGQRGGGNGNGTPPQQIVCHTSTPPDGDPEDQAGAVA